MKAARDVRLRRRTLPESRQSTKGTNQPACCRFSTGDLQAVPSRYDPCRLYLASHFLNSGRV